MLQVARNLLDNEDGFLQGKRLLLILLGESHLRAAVREYLAHYHEARN